MLQGLSHQAREAKSWPFEQARLLLGRILRLRLAEAERDEASALIAEGKAAEAVQRFPALAAKPVVFQCGYGASGLPHMGTFGEAARPTMVRTAFRALTEDAIPTRLIVFSDDMDGLRKIPDNVPNRHILEEDRDKPVTSVRDPFGEHESFGAHNNARLLAFLDGFGFDYDFYSSTECYKSGRFDEVLLRVLARFDAIQAIMLPTLGEERRATYSPFLPISPKTGKVLQAPTVGRDVDKGTITFPDEDGTLTEVPVTGGHVKLQWRPDWAARWTALEVDYEMSGKDLVDSVRVSNRVCKALGGEPPEAFHYELFMDENNQKISKSKGNGLTMEEWLRYGTPESLAYYMYQSPKSAKRLYFDVIPKATDEYLQQLDAFNRARGESPTPAIDNPAWHVHRGSPPDKGSPVSFSLLLNLVSAADASTKEILWAFIERYIPGASPESEPLLDKLAGYAINYYEDFVKPSKKFRAPTDQERAAMQDLVARLKALPPGADAEAIQNEVFEVGKTAGFEPLRAWFAALYEVLLGQPTGPRFGSFVAIFGVNRTLRLINAALLGRLTLAARSRIEGDIDNEVISRGAIKTREAAHPLSESAYADYFVPDLNLAVEVKSLAEGPATERYIRNWLRHNPTYASPLNRAEGVRQAFLSHISDDLKRSNERLWTAAKSKPDANTVLVVYAANNSSAPEQLRSHIEAWRATALSHINHVYLVDVATVNSEGVRHWPLKDTPPLPADLTSNLHKLVWRHSNRHSSTEEEKRRETPDVDTGRG